MNPVCEISSLVGDLLCLQKQATRPLRISPLNAKRCSPPALVLFRLSWVSFHRHSSPG
jgi:hypothetical protein